MTFPRLSFFFVFFSLIHLFDTLHQEHFLLFPCCRHHRLHLHPHMKIHHYKNFLPHLLHIYLIINFCLRCLGHLFFCFLNLNHFIKLSSFWILWFRFVNTILFTVFLFFLLLLLLFLWNFFLIINAILFPFLTLFYLLFFYNICFHGNVFHRFSFISWCNECIVRRIIIIFMFYHIFFYNMISNS